MGCVAYSSLLEDDASEYPVIFFNVRRDLCLLPYSSGTAGCARPVTLTHHNMVAQLCQLMWVFNKVNISLSSWLKLAGCVWAAHHGPRTQPEAMVS